MAGDLIPPPSPAGRPDPDGRGDEEARHGWLEDKPPERVQETAFADAPVDESEPEPVLPAKPPPSRYKSRFGFVLGALVGLGVAALVLGGLLVLGTGSDDDAPANWSSWKPSADDGYAAAEQIASHVQTQYRGADGDQLVTVEASPLQVENLQLSIALRSASSGGNIQVIDDKTVMYTLNGLGPRGSIKEGKPSAQRLSLLKREALELALYTFRYVGDVEGVVALLPPPPPAADTPAGTASEATPLQALYFRPGDLKRQLDRPLNRTVPAPAPRPETLPPTHASSIEQLTRPNTFLASFTQGQNAKAFLVLDRPQG